MTRVYLYLLLCLEPGIVLSALYIFPDHSASYFIPSSGIKGHVTCRMNQTFPYYLMDCLSPWRDLRPDVTFTVDWTLIMKTQSNLQLLHYRLQSMVMSKLHYRPQSMVMSKLHYRLQSMVMCKLHYHLQKMVMIKLYYCVQNMVKNKLHRKTTTRTTTKT